MKKPTFVFDNGNHHNGKNLSIPVRYLQKPTNETEYAALEEVLDVLIDTIRDDENHPLTIVMQIIGRHLEEYDNEHNDPIGKGLTEIERVKYLMASHGLHQKDLADIFGGQANVSHFLSGKRSLNKNHIIQLKNRFKLSADYFIV